MTVNKDDTICPLCQQQNQCGIAAEHACWCTKVKVPSELTQQVPASLKNNVCICQACIEKFNIDNAQPAK